jgi:hypothetical protein
MALTSGTIFQIQATATTGNTGGSGFNPANAGMLADLAATSATGASPVVSSVSYNFVAGDVNNYLYVKSGTNWIAGWYKIVSVAANAATLDASIGAVVLSIGRTGIIVRNVSTGCASVASPTAGTFTVDYSQTDTSVINGIADFASTAASTTLTSATAGFTPVMVGNFFHQTTTGTGGFGVVGWYEIATYTNATSVVLDRSPDSGTGSVACTGFVGGAGRLNGLEDTYQAMLPSASIVWIKNGSYTLSSFIGTANANATVALSTFWIGYNTLRGDTCNGANRPLIAAGANGVTFSAFQGIRNLSFTTTAANGISISSSSVPNFNCKFINTSTAAARYAFSISNGVLFAIACEFISQNGNGISNQISGTHQIYGCYIHDSNNGISTLGTNGVNIYIGNLVESCVTSAITIPTGYVYNIIENNTLYGREAIMGIGINLLKPNSAQNNIINNNIYGFTTGISVSTGASSSNLSQYNNFFNNTTDVTNWIKDSSDLALNPTFTNVSQVTGTVGQGLAGSTFQDSTKNFLSAGVVANQDFLHITSGGTLTAGCYLITAITTTTNPNDTLTLNNNPGTGTATGVYWITVGHNFQIGTNLKAQGFPNFTNTAGGLTTSYMDVGAIQRQESGGSTSSSRTFVG